MIHNAPQIASRELRHQPHWSLQGQDPKCEDSAIALNWYRDAPKKAQLCIRMNSINGTCNNTQSGVPCQWGTQRWWQWPRRCKCIVWAIGKYICKLITTTHPINDDNVPHQDTTMKICHTNNHTQQQQQHASSTMTHNDDNMPRQWWGMTTRHDNDGAGEGG